MSPADPLLVTFIYCGNKRSQCSLCFCSLLNQGFYVDLHLLKSMQSTWLHLRHRLVSVKIRASSQCEGRGILTLLVYCLTPTPRASL